ncbi:MAG: hypothetical protein HOH77_18560 [Candidatus Latescibacteria bacterium]|nr:hypothetical protein [Candidatus Latescibacterota bacterium]
MVIEAPGTPLVALREEMVGCANAGILEHSTPNSKSQHTRKWALALV